jgi:hypothetical protein
MSMAPQPSPLNGDASIAAASTSAYGIQSAWRKQASSLRSAVSVIGMTRRSPKPSMDSTRPKSSGEKAFGNPWMRSNTPP